MTSGNKNIRYKNIFLQLTLFTLAILAGMTLYELLRPVVFHNIVAWELDHIVAVFLGTACAMTIAYIVLARHRESEERYRLAIERSGDGVVMVRDKGYFYVNQRFLDIFEYDSRDEVLGKPLTINVHPDDKERVVNIFEKRQKGESVPGRYEFKGIKKNGESVFIEVSVAGIAYHKKPASLAYMRDITDRIRIEEQKLYSAKLESALEMAGAVCHELNQPLQIISGSVDILLRGEAKNGQVKRLDTIKEQTFRMGTITKKLMGFKEYSTRDYVGKTKIFDLDEKNDRNNAELNDQER